MIRANLGKQQRQMIRQACQIQIQSILRLHDHWMDRIKKEMQECGYDIEDEDIHFEMASVIESFDRVIDDPNALFGLDNTHFSILKHILLNYFEAKNDVETQAEIWRYIINRETLIEPNLN